MVFVVGDAPLSLVMPKLCGHFFCPLDREFIEQTAMFIATHTSADPQHRVLVVDDEPDILFLLRLLLEGAGFQVDHAMNGRDAIELATRACQHVFDVVVLDISMPGSFDGIAVASEIRACEFCRKTRIVFHTALPEDHVRARFSDYDHFLEKPVEGQRLVKCVKHLAGARERGPQ